ncbi:MAG: trehalose-phosphatase [Polaromonas sp.]|nr:trehalose-phosphatase [Polaromonas sp.]
MPLPLSIVAASALPGIDAQTALFLDFDGTLADLAPQPEAVQLVADLIPVLTQLAAQLNGALAIVSGRRLADLDGFLAPLQLPSAAEHGAQRRVAQGQVICLASPDLQAVVRLATALAARHAGLRVEIKSAAVALHYRHAPELQTLAQQVMRDAAHGTPGLELLCGKSVFEVKPAGISKGTAIEAFMASAPFAGRRPLFAGDDVTDEAGFSAVQRLGGQGIKVGEGRSLARFRCPSPDALRQWLRLACPPIATTPSERRMNRMPP